MSEIRAEVYSLTPITTHPKHYRWTLLLPGVLTLVVHGPGIDNFLYTHDGWNDVQLGENLLDGNLELRENLTRIVPTLSFAVRALFGLEMWAWHLPNIFLHGLNAYLVLWLAAFLSKSRTTGLFASLLFATAPLLSHPVEWVGGSYDLFATTGVLIAIRGACKGSPWQAALGTLLAMLSKEVGVVTCGVAFCCFAAANGLPKTKAHWLDSGRRILPILLATSAVAGLRVLQVTLVEDPFAGRAIEADFGQWVAACPAAIGFAGIASLADVLGQQQPTGLEPVGFVLFAVLVIATAGRRLWQVNGWLLIAAAGSLIPVSLIGMGLEEMLQNPRYLYLATALTAPIVPLLLAPRTRLNHLTLSALIAVGAWTTLDRTLKSRQVTSGVKPVAEAVLASPEGTRIWVFSGFYDEPTSRFLMSQWLSARRGIRAGYVMRGQDRVFVRLGDAQTDAAQAYFKPLALRVRPALTDIQLLQTLGDEPAAEPIPNSNSQSLRRTAEKSWVTVPNRWIAVAPKDSEDPFPIVNGTELQANHYLGPVASAELHPVAALSIDRPITGLELTLKVQSAAKVRYASGYHERFGAIFFGPNWSPRHAMSFELDADSETPQVISLTWEDDPIAPKQPSQIGLLPLNYPGKVTVMGVRVR